MTLSSGTTDATRPSTRSPWLRLAALVLAVGAVGLPINGLYAYALLLVAAVLIFCGHIDARPGRWLAAVAVVAAAASLPWLVAPVPIQQGLNVFLPIKTGNVFERKLPNEVYRALKTEFDAVYPPAVRCKPGSSGCWQDQGEPDQLYAFSADSPFAAPAYSRMVSGLDFSDAVWLRLGFVNDMRYNWFTAAPDVHRADRDRRFWMGLHRWHIAMPWFMMLRFPADYAGSRLCWRGEMLWPSAKGPYQAVRNGTHGVPHAHARHHRQADLRRGDQARLARHDAAPAGGGAGQADRRRRGRARWRCSRCCCCWCACARQTRSGRSC